ncbi:MAG: sarcosine oxidase [Thermomicrobiales bacterium]|nr:sarcosine oxidase [Thermomicrobiales bacterium]
MDHYSVIVIGGGTMGTAAAWELGKRGERAIVFEQFGHVHTMGAHSGQTRVIRHAYAEGAGYIPLVLRADELWEELEAEARIKVLHRVGALEISTGLGSDHAQRARASAALHNVPFEWLDADEIRRRWPQFQIGDDWEAGFGDRSGFLEVEPALRAMASSARSRGVEIREHEPAQAWGTDGEGVWVQTEQGRYTADRLIVTPGSWAGRMLPDLGLPITVVRKTLFWLEVKEPTRFDPAGFPVFIADRPGLELYGFPIFGQPGLKCANHAGGEPTTVETVDRTVRPEEEPEILDAAGWLFGPEQFTGRVLLCAVCLYARTPDHDFAIDRHPEYPNVVIGAGFSGHGFKFTPAVGEHLVQLALDDSNPLELFSLNRFAATGIRATT